MYCIVITLKKDNTYIYVLMFLESSSNKKKREEYDLDQKIKMAYCSKQLLWVQKLPRIMIETIKVNHTWVTNDKDDHTQYGGDQWLFNMLLSAGKLFLIITNIYQHKLFYFDNIGFLSEPWILMTNYKIYIKQEAPGRP